MGTTRSLRRTGSAAQAHVDVRPPRKREAASSRLACGSKRPSLGASRIALVTQRIECWLPVPDVAGSNPVAGASGRTNAPHGRRVDTLAERTSEEAAPCPQSAE